MKTTITTAADTPRATISVTGQLTFDAFRQFHDALGRLPPGTREVTVDLSGADYLDSAGLGLLVQAREKLAGVATLNVTVAEGSSVARTLLTAHFEKLLHVQTV